MDERKLEKLRAELERMRRATVKASDVEALARKLGRRQVNRGKEPVWESDLDDVYPLSIPHHGGGRDLPNGTKNSILNSLEVDLEAWEQHLAAEDDDGK